MFLIFRYSIVEGNSENHNFIRPKLAFHIELFSCDAVTRCSQFDHKSENRCHTIPLELCALSNVIVKLKIIVYSTRSVCISRSQNNSILKT